MVTQLDTNRRRLLKHSLALAVVALTGCPGEDQEGLPVGDVIAPSNSTPSPSTPPGTTPPGTTPPSTTTPPTSTTPSPPTAPTGVWVPAVPTLIVGSGSTFDLARTLPSGVAQGGRFGVDPSGPPLPSGMNLQTNGLLSVGSATVGTVDGVLFTYDEP
jgi:hypothetical protein